MESPYAYKPSHVLPAVFAALVGLSMLCHIYQNLSVNAFSRFVPQPLTGYSRYRYWKVTFFMFWASSVFTAGWVLRCISSFYPYNLNLYIAQTVLVYAGPPIFAAAEYNVLGRLMSYLPMHAPLNPGHTLYFFIYISAAVEALTAAGAATLGTAKGDIPLLIRGGTLISASLVIQAAIECVFVGLVALMHYRCVRARAFPRNVRALCLMLYGTSTFVLLRCILRAIESFTTMTVTHCNAVCHVVLLEEWYLYAFEAAPMVLYTYWVNIVHPGRLLPTEPKRYLDIDGQTERIGPGWMDSRSRWEAFADPIDLGGLIRGQPARQPFWERPEDWPKASNGSFAQGTASNVREKQ